MAKYDPDWKTNKGIQLAKQACADFDGDMAIVIVMRKGGLATDGEGRCQGFSYGNGKTLCKEAGERLDDALKGIANG
jgi:hypothetical protein